MSKWSLVYNKFNPKSEGLREALCVVGNGYFATRGALCEVKASENHYPGTYIAGVYNKTPTKIADRDIYNEDLVNCPNWLVLTFKIENGEWINPSNAKILFYKEELDIKNGILTHEILFQDKKGRKTDVKTSRIVHMKDPHLALIRYVITPLNYEGMITVKSGIDGSVENTGVERYRSLNTKHLVPCSLKAIGKNTVSLTVRTSQSRINITESARTRIFSSGREIKNIRTSFNKTKNEIYCEFKIPVKRKKKYEIEKTVSIYTSKDWGIKNYKKASIQAVKKAGNFVTLFKIHTAEWKNLWEKFDIKISGDDYLQMVLRLHMLHLLQTASIHNTKIDAGLPARGLHGEAYRGHIFWDELFVMPLFNHGIPEISKALLMYRYRRLNEARKYAKKYGYKGSMFPWQSGSTGVEETQEVHLNPLSGKWGADASRIQRHISFAIAYNVWEYWISTRDIKFMGSYGAEILLSIARFVVSITKKGKDGRYHTEGIMGPDEFHEKLPGNKKFGVKDNAYSNLLISWILLRAGDVLKVLSGKEKNKLTKKMKIKSSELKKWQDISHKMKIIINKDGIISQFDGYFGLKELDWGFYKKKYGDIHRLDRILKAEGKSPDDYKLAKQADVLMMFYLLPLPEIKNLFANLGYVFNGDTLKKNYEYYVNRTSHGSTLSKVVHCYIAHLLGRKREAWSWYEEVLKSDVADTQGGTTPEGIHAGVMGGSIYIVKSGFVGLEILDDHVKINPKVPSEWTDISLNFPYQRRWVSLKVTRDKIFISGVDRRSKPSFINIEVYEKQYKINLKRSNVIKYCVSKN